MRAERAAFLECQGDASRHRGRTNAHVVAPERAVEENSGGEQRKRARVQAWPNSGMHLSSQGEGAMREACDEVLLLWIKAWLVHDLETDVALPVVEHTAVQHVDNTLCMRTRREEQRAQRKDGDVGQRLGAQGPCTVVRRLRPLSRLALALWRSGTQPGPASPSHCQRGLTCWRSWAAGRGGLVWGAAHLP